jgi:tRNA/tmRNA/rRNA uracil-C5-methylase (TrmA/RlmC/RlmD family)
VRSIHWSENESPAEVTNLPTQLLWGEDAIEEELCGLRFVSARTHSSRRTPRWRSVSIGIAREFAALTGGETVYDLYCGIGTIGSSMARRTRLTVWGIDVSEESIACATRERDLNGSATRPSSRETSARRRGAARARAVTRTSSSSTRRARGLAGKALKRLGEIGAPRHRLRLLQPDHARLAT